MAKSSIKKRIKITKTGKTMHRKKGQGHCKSTKRTSQTFRKKGSADMDISEQKIKEFMH